MFWLVKFKLEENFYVYLKYLHAFLLYERLMAENVVNTYLGIFKVLYVYCLLSASSETINLWKVVAI
jgi:hypothetical protein